MAIVALLLCCLLMAGCAGSSSSPRRPSRSPLAVDLASARRLGVGARFRPPATSAAVARAQAVDGMRCSAPRAPAFQAHLEVYAAGHVVLVPAGIGVAPPFARRGAFVVAQRCVYALHTFEQTGRVLSEDNRVRTLGELFDLWGEPLGAQRLLGFRTPPRRSVAAYVNGRRWRGPLRRVPVFSHAEITLEIGPYVPPHGGYSFPSLSASRRPAA